MEKLFKINIHWRTQAGDLVLFNETMTYKKSLCRIRFNFYELL